MGFFGRVALPGLASMSRLRSLFLAPTAIWMLALIAAPTAIVCAYSLLTRGTYGGLGLPWSVASYRRLADPLYLTLLARSFVLAGIATAICLALGFPLALFISRAGHRKHLYLSLVILPFWTSFLVRTYAWMFLLRDTGLINTALQALGIVRQPLPLLYNDGAVILGLVYGYLPFIVLPVFATLERLDPSVDRGIGRSRCATAHNHAARGSAAGETGHHRRRSSGIHPVPRRLPHAGPARRRQERNDRQPHPEPVHQRPRLAVRFGRFPTADGHRHGAADGRPPPRRRQTPVKRLLTVQAAAIYAFLYLPLAVLAVFSFNASRFTVWKGFSLDWYKAAFANQQLVDGAWNSLLIGVAATAIATLVGTLAAYALWKRASRVIAAGLYISLVTPEIVMGISLLAFYQWVFRYLHVRLGMHTVVLAHVTFCLAYVVLVVLARLRTLDPVLEEAAMDLGATEWQAFVRVVLPNLAPGIIAGALLAFATSFDDYVITSLVAGVDSETLPMVIYSMARRGISPAVNAISTMIVFGLGAFILLAQRLERS